jgi:pimeloyl-ACP methyl ester carboxylesterase
LAQLDARVAWHSLTMPALLLLAEEDALVPVAVANDLKHLAMPSQSVDTVPGGHAIAWQYGHSDKDILLSRIGDFLEPLYV